MFCIENIPPKLKLDVVFTVRGKGRQRGISEAVCGDVGYRGGKEYSRSSLAGINYSQ